MDMQETNDEGLDAAIAELFVAVRKYREYLKRNHRDRLHGVLFVKEDHQLLVYSASEKYSNALLRLTWSEKGDEWSLQEHSGT